MKGLSELPEAFPPEFVAMLERILRSGDRIWGARVETARALRMQIAQSGVFTGHRPYFPGDDPRWIDWNACARNGGLYVKLLEEEQQRGACIVFETSPRMHAGSPPRRTGALRLAAILGGLALRQIDTLRVVGGSSSRELHGRSGPDALLDALRALPVELADPLRIARDLSRRGDPGRILWISDFAEPASFEPALRMLRSRNHRVVGWLPAIEEDRRVRRRGLSRLLDPDDGREITASIDDELAAAMEEQLRALARQQDSAFAECGYALERFPVPPLDDFRISSWLGAAWSYRS
ncbi:MAG: DUF58 domain-containing protein [Planctomycetota bacterium]